MELVTGYSAGVVHDTMFDSLSPSGCVPYTMPTFQGIAVDSASKCVLISFLTAIYHPLDGVPRPTDFPVPRTADGYASIIQMAGHIAPPGMNAGGTDEEDTLILSRSHWPNLNIPQESLLFQHDFDSFRMAIVEDHEVLRLRSLVGEDRYRDVLEETLWIQMNHPIESTEGSLSCLLLRNGPVDLQQADCIEQAFDRRTSTETRWVQISSNPE
jgi:hypothetical protein